MASGEILPNLGSTKLKGTGTLNGSPIHINTQVAEITKPLASVDEMVSGGMMVIMHRTGGIAKRLDIDTERKIRDLVKGSGGHEVVLERAGGAFTFEIDVKSEEKEGTATAAAGAWKVPRNPAKASSRNMDVDETVIAKSYFESIWEEQECDELECKPCEPFFQRH